MIDTLIIGKDSKFGLTKDFLLLRDALQASGVGGEIKVRGIRDRPLWKRLIGAKEAKQAVHIERAFPRWFSAAERHFLIPNQERFPHRHLPRLRRIDTVLAKSHHAAEIFRSHGAHVEYLGFTSEDQRDPSVTRDWKAILHLAGGSTLKGTEDILTLWSRHPEWPRLTLVQREYLGPLPVPPNVTLISGYVTDEEVRRIQNAHGIHLCPSRAEGWGHHLVESMSTAALVITTDAPPMNEHLSADSAIMVPYARTEPRRIGMCFFVDLPAFENAIATAISMPESEKMALGQKARVRFEEIDRGFHERLSAIFGPLPVPMSVAV